MAIISKPNTFSASTSISSSQVNSNFDTIYNEFNGSIAAANLATDSVTTAKIANSNVTTAKIADSNVTTAKIADDGVTAAKIDWASTGANAGIWWEELGRTTLGSAGDTISVTSIPARKYLKVIVQALPSGSINGFIQFNADTGANYAYRNSANGAADATATSQTSGFISSTATALPFQSEMLITNITAQEKIVSFFAIHAGGAGAANAPQRVEGVVKWANTAAQITRVDIINASTGDFAADSEVVVLGHN